MTNVLLMVYPEYSPVVYRLVQETGCKPESTSQLDTAARKITEDFYDIIVVSLGFDFLRTPHATMDVILEEYKKRPHGFLFCCFTEDIRLLDNRFLWSDELQRIWISPRWKDEFKTSFAKMKKAVERRKAVVEFNYGELSGVPGVNAALMSVPVVTPGGVVVPERRIDLSVGGVVITSLSVEQAQEAHSALGYALCHHNTYPLQGTS